MAEAERWLAERWNVAFEELDLDEVEPEVGGVLMVRPHDGGMRVQAVLRPGLDAYRRESLAAWVDERLSRFTEHGPEPDGWQRRRDGGWQLWARLVWLPPI